MTRPADNEDLAGDEAVALIKALALGCVTVAVIVLIFWLVL